MTEISQHGEYSGYTLDNFPIYGMTNYVTQFITDKFRGEIAFDKSKVNITSLDIEVVRRAEGGGAQVEEVSSRRVVI